MSPERLNLFWWYIHTGVLSRKEPLCGDMSICWELMILEI